MSGGAITICRHDITLLYAATSASWHQDYARHVYVDIIAGEIIEL